MANEAQHPPWWNFGHLFGQADNARNDGQEQSKWSMGILNDKLTVEVPGSVLLLARDHNEPLGMRNIPRRMSHSSLPVGLAFDASTRPSTASQALPVPRPVAPTHVDDEISKKKRTADGTIILDPQPEDSANDPLNWPAWRRDSALLSLGFYCMIGGGVTPMLAAGFTNIAKDYSVPVEKVALSTGLYMMGLGLGSVVASPTAILWGKRPVYLGSAILFIASSLWAGFSPNYPSFLAARIIQGVAVSPVECLPSATIAEIFFLHERAYRIGIYTLLLLSGKNLIPLISALIIGQLSWRWVFYIVSLVVAFALIFLFLFVPETFWDRKPIRRPSRRMSLLRRLSSYRGHKNEEPSTVAPNPEHVHDARPSLALSEHHKDMHVGFAADFECESESKSKVIVSDSSLSPANRTSMEGSQRARPVSKDGERNTKAEIGVLFSAANTSPESAKAGEKPSNESVDEASFSDVALERDGATRDSDVQASDSTCVVAQPSTAAVRRLPFKQPLPDVEKMIPSAPHLCQTHSYTHSLRQSPPQTFVQQLKPYRGRINPDNWFKVMLRPFILFAYPSVLWSAIIYACSIGWLIVMSETLAIIFRNPDSYNFTAIQAGLVYVSPFVGGILGTGVAGKISDVIVRAMARRNGGLYEPEFRLVMAIPILITTCAGLIGFGWAAEEREAWIVPTVFFGIVSFGCSLGSTTSITFCVDSYRQYAGEALVTLNFSKNIFHGLVFSLFVSEWLTHDGSKKVYIWLGVIQALLCCLSLPMYIYGKRARMWTVRMNLMEKL